MATDVSKNTRGCNMSIEELREGVADIETLESGTEIGRDKDGRLKYARWKDGTTQYYENSTITGIEKPDGTFIKYKDGKIDYFTDPRGNTFKYDENGKISSFIDKDGFTVEYKDGKPVAITDPSMRKYEMDENGNLQQVRESAFEDRDPAKRALKGEMMRNAHNAKKLEELKAKETTVNMAHALGAVERGRIEQTMNRNTMRLIDAMSNRGR